MDSRQPSEARSLYLNGRTVEEKAAILERASQIGPGPEDADWVVALAAENAAKRIEAAVKKIAMPVAGPVTLAPESLAALGRIESRIGEIEERLGQMPTVRMIEPLFVRANDDPIAAPARDLTVFVIALLASVAVVTIASAPILRSPVVLVAAFVLGVSCALGYLWLEPIIAPAIERQRRKRR